MASEGRSRWTGPQMWRWAALAVLAQACAGQQSESAADPEPARTVRIEMSIKSALLEDEQVSAAPIQITYESGVVRLTGFVETPAERERAAMLARKAAPDVRIENELEVWGVRSDEPAARDGPTAD